ncbi:O-antigen ligase domain-containing protein [Geobacillus kaustophilus NBRC 102445]|uniref:O-antigen ligase family protein n=1 Tax=Geobacillus thermoleovorans group TaxID=1505648 RepID=UPI0005A95B76|nr:O-antigen ligase family protein [Geobacillus kaustophilus]MED4974619.1 O-antigen ligase family protein [Geobacillus thermoleovorans]QCK81232.1 O-antigen ligase domain-containing protein [Geobacillus kaustophilus NBRC 102445]
MDNLKSMKVIDTKIFILISLIISPFIYQWGPIVFLVNVFMQILLLLYTKENVDTKIWMVYLLSFSYFGLELFGVRIYDLIMVVSIIFLFLINFKLQIRLVDVFLFIIFIIYIIFTWSINGFYYQGFIEISRYLFSFLTFILFFNLKPRWETIIKFIPIISIGNIIQAIELYILTLMNKVVVFNSNIFSVNYFNNTQEMRLNGFFTDPNKFLCFFLFLFILFEFIHTTKKIRMPFKYCLITRFVLILGVLISFSRTGLVVVVLYLVLNLTKRIFHKYNVYVWIIFLLIGFFIITLFSRIGYLTEVLNYIFVITTKILGRDRTFEINSFITEDNRYLIWNTTIEYIKMNPLIGYGPLSFERLLPYPPHNTYLTLLLDLGLLGCILFILLIKPLFKITELEVIIPFIVIPSLLLDLSNFRLLYILLAISIVSGYYKKPERVAKRIMDA